MAENDLTLPPASSPSPPKAPGPRDKIPITELPRLTGHTVKLRFPAERTIPDAAHEAASTLHGWAAHEHHTGAPIELTIAQYEAALKAAASPPKGSRRLQPFKAALSPHCPHRFGGDQEKD